MAAKGKIFIIDDEIKYAKMLRLRLESSGYTVNAINDSTKAFEAIILNPPDLILLDVLMPKPDGHQLCKKLKRTPETKDIPVIFLTAKSDTEDVLKGFKIGGVDYITKPADSQILLSRVKTHVDLKKIRDAQKILISQLEESLLKIKQLSRLLPMCANCKKIRDDDGFWQDVEAYISEHSQIEWVNSV